MIIHHYGIVVSDVEKNIDLYIKLGYILSTGIVYDDFQKNKIAFMCSDFSPKIELIEAVDDSSTVSNFKPGYHHICYEAEPNEDIIQRFREMKIGKIFTKPIIAPALDNREVVFGCLQNGTFVEFII